MDFLRDLIARINGYESERWHDDSALREEDADDELELMTENE